MALVSLHEKEVNKLRDYLCENDNCKLGIEYNAEFIEINNEEIKDLEKDIQNEVQKYSGDNKSIMELSYLDNFLSRINVIRGNYSIGVDIDSIESSFLNAVNDLENIGGRGIDYLNLLWMVSLGILLETDKENIKRLSEIIKKQNVNDFVIDYLLCASDIGWTHISNNFVEEIPYSKTKEIIELAEKDKEAASDKLHTYMEKAWFKGHYDYEWKNAHKEPGYVGFWSFESAALAKILSLDDTSLKDNNHYPYDLAHYKRTMSFPSFSLNDYLEKPAKKKHETEDWVEGIENNPSLEQIIPGKWHAFINALIGDYETLDDDAFYDKYKNPMELDQIWFFKDEYKEANKDNDILG